MPAQHILERIPERVQELVQERPKVGLVLAGGGARGFAHIAVLEMLEELDIQVDLIIGVSAGSIVGGLYSAGYSTEMVKTTFMSIDWTSIFTDAPGLPFENELGSGDFLFRHSLKKGKESGGFSPGQEAYSLLKAYTLKIPSYIDFDDLAIPFRAGVSEMAGRKFELLDKGDLAEAIRASMSIPGIFDSLDIDGKRYIDGGILNNLPIRMAKEMGCDIIIASELSYGPDNLTDNMLKVPELILNLYFDAISEVQYEIADVLIKPDLRAFSIMDFPKSHEIYNFANSDREIVLKELTKIKELLSAGEKEQAQNKNFSYNELPFFIPDSLKITGALERDRKFIENYFSKHIKGNLLDEKSIADLIGKVYETSNYRFVAARIDTRQDNTILEMRLYQADYKNTDLILGGYYHGTFSGNSMNKAGIMGGVQIKGLSGPGSVLSVTASVINVIGAEILYMQPISTKSFISARVNVILDQYISASGFYSENAEEERLLYFSGGISGGYFLNRFNMLKADAVIFMINPKDTLFGTDGRNTAVNFNAAFTHNSLDYLFLPSKGIFVGVENRFYLPLPFNDPVFFNILSLDFRAGLPLNRRFSVSAGFFAGADLSSNLSDFYNLRLGFTALDRQYLPNVSSINLYYSYKFAASLSLQLQPWIDRVIMGGSVIFSLSASAGLLFDKPEEMDFKNMIWNSSLNTGFRLNKNFGLILRIGVCSADSSPILPFIALDIGRIQRSGIKPVF